MAGQRSLREVAYEAWLGYAPTRARLQRVEKDSADAARDLSRQAARQAAADRVAAANVAGLPPWRRGSSVMPVPTDAAANILVASLRSFRAQSRAACAHDNQLMSQFRAKLLPLQRQMRRARVEIQKHIARFRAALVPTAASPSVATAVASPSVATAVASPSDTTAASPSVGSPPPPRPPTPPPPRPSTPRPSTPRPTRR